MAISIADSSCSSPRSSLAFLLDPEEVEPPRPKQSMWHRLGLRRLLGRDDRDSSSRSPESSDASTASNTRAEGLNSPPPPKSHDNLTRRLSRKVGVGLPRSTTFKRQHSEPRDRLTPAESEPRRAASADRRSLSPQRTNSPQSVVDPRLSAPEISSWPREDLDPDPSPTKVDHLPEANEEIVPQDNDARSEWDHYPEVTDTPDGYPVNSFDMELERRWILNLSMHFRDGSEKEKFFVTYAEAANRWRRVTISCDYRDAEPESLEEDLKELRYQRDKCARIYESIRESLPDIQFYDTVTNLKLETRDGRLHVHVTEDANEIIPYPPISSIGHLPNAQLIPEHRLNFEAHLSGFVYNVRLGQGSFIKKEIPGPDTVDEFLYEINALHALKATPNVIQVEGIVVDDRQDVVKGLLISYAEKGALVDILYEDRGTISWGRRERWARQIVHGLCEIHESGYVQGDFTLSNIVVDANDNAKIIDINRRGCPVGWEPPEIAAKIESNQRISMYIGVKTDLFQLGMTLWALAMEEDEPERRCRPYMLEDDLPVPDYYRRVVSICLSPIPRHRLSAKELLNFFPPDAGAFDYLPRRTPHTSIGVGLHNGALPLYDSRTAFPYARGRQMGSFGNNNTHTPDQPLIDSFESSPSPETDDVYNREEQERQMRSNGITAQTNGISKEESIMFDQPDSVDGLIPVSVDSPARHDNFEEFQSSPPQDCDEHISFDVNPLQRVPSEESAIEPIGSPQPLSNQEIDLGSWEPRSRSSSLRHDLPGSFETSQPSVDIYPVSSVAEYWPDHERLQSMPMLRHSVLPINPAAEEPAQGVPLPGDVMPPTSGLTGSPQQVNNAEGIDTRDSSLPISPAAQSPDLSPVNVLNQPPSGIQSVFEHDQDVMQSPCLSDSLLPIDPAAKLPELEPSGPKHEIPSELGSDVSPGYPQQTDQDSSPNLNESRLPINPAAELPDTATRMRDSAVSQIPSSHCPLDAIRDQDHSSFLMNSKLPINPATMTFEKAPPHAPAPSDILNTYPQTITHSLLPTDRPSQFPKEERINKDFKSISSLEPSAPCNSQSNAHDPIFNLNDSLLPINPASSDQTLQCYLYGLR